MPTTRGLPPTTRPNNPSDALCRVLTAGRIADESEWRQAYDQAVASDDLVLLAPFCHWGTTNEQTAIQDALIRHTARNQLFLHILRQCLTWFAEAGVPCRVLKGAATIQDCYDGIGQRRLGDIDLLVPKDRLGAAATILLTNGFRPLEPALVREALQDPHTLTADGDAHHHWPPLVGPDGVVVELHWTLGDGAMAMGLDDAALWADSTPLPVGDALAWEHRALQATLAGPAAPRAVADLAALTRRASADQRTAFDRLTAPRATDQTPRTHITRWQRLRTPARWALFVRLGWQAWRHPRHLATLPLPETARRLINQPRWRGRVTPEEVVAYVGFWQRQRWLARPSYCLQRSALLFAGLTAIGERVSLVFGLDPDQPDPIGHAWVERDGAPFREDAALLARMVTTYRFPAQT